MPMNEQALRGCSNDRPDVEAHLHNKCTKSASKF